MMRIGKLSEELSKGRLVAEALTGAWRRSPPTLNLSEDELAVATPLLYDSGGAALGWWQIHHSDLRATPPALQLQQAYQLQRLYANIHEREIKYILALLKSVGVEPVLVKGWAVAHLYPDKALRPYGDIDLCVPPEQFEMAQAALKCLESLDGHCVDLHSGFAKLDDSSWDELYERSQQVEIGDEKARVLSAEDHLRILCLHLLKSDAWRPLWLCDVAMMLETRTADFDWERCLGGNPLYADWVACTIGLAHQLLKVDIEDTPIAERAKRLPGWLVPAVLRQWGRCLNQDTIGMAMPALLRHLKEPGRLLNEIYVRWDHPVRATVEVHGRFNDWPRLPYQLWALLRRSPEVPIQLMKLLRKQFRKPGLKNEAIALRA